MKNQIKVIVYTVVISLSLSTCTEVHSTDHHVIYINPQKFSSKSISDFYQVTEIIPLETNEYSLIGRIDNIIFNEDKIIIGEYRGDAFLIFSRKGIFLEKVDRRGNGPHEYGSRLGMYVVDQANPYNNLIMNRSPRLLYYDFNNWKVVKEAKWVGSSAILGSLPNGDFLAYQEYGVENHFIRLLNQDGVVLKGFLSKPSHLSFTLPSIVLSPFVFHQNNRIFVLPPLTHTIFEYNHIDTLLLEKYVLDIKNCSPVNFNQLSQNDIDSWKHINDYYRVYYMHFGNNILAISASMVSHDPDKPPIICFINMQTHDTETFNYAKLMDSELEMPLSHFMPTNIDSPVAVVMPEQLINYTTTRSDSWGAKLKKEIREDSNPILLIYKER